MSLGHLIVLSLALGVGAWLFFLWSVKSGQYDDPEGPKYRMLDDEEDEGDPAGSTAPRRPGRPGNGPPADGSAPGGAPEDGQGEAGRGRR